MKSILISIRPEWVEKILNHRKTIELRKTAPRAWADYLSSKSFEKPTPIDVYIYCTNGKPLTRLGTLWNGDRKTDVFSLSYPPNATYNGKVVGKFKLRKVDMFDMGANQSKDYQTFDDYKEILKDACLSKRELEDYLGCRMLDMACHFYAWHISDLEVFDEPKELGEFSYLVRKFHVDGFVVPLYGKVAKAPQSWQYVEVGE